MSQTFCQLRLRFHTWKDLKEKLIFIKPHVLKQKATADG